LGEKERIKVFPDTLKANYSPLQVGSNEEIGQLLKGNLSYIVSENGLFLNKYLGDKCNIGLNKRKCLQSKLPSR